MKLDVRPLVDYCERTYQPRNEDYRANTGTTQKVVSMTGVSRNAVLRWMREGVPLWRADEIAVKRLGVHPVVVWRDWFDAGRETVDS